MALQYKIETLDGVEESIQTLYKKTDDGYQLDVEGATSKQKVDDFRDNNIDLTNQMQALQDKFDGLDIGQFNQMFKSVQQMVQSDADTEMQTALEAGTDAVKKLIEDRAAVRSETMKTDYQTQLDEAQGNTNRFRQQLEDSKITAELSRIAAEKGVRPTAVDDVLLRGKQVFSLNEEGEVVALKDGDVVYNKDNKPLSINEYVADLSATAPHLFETSSGGGSDNSNKTQGSKKGDTFVYRGQDHAHSS